jgi:NADH-quinone oxidoreductase subunit J
MEAVFFFVFAISALTAALSMILQKNIIYSALSLIVVIGSMGGLFLLLNATFIAVLQIVIYAGAIMTLFLFVIMMVEPQVEIKETWRLQTKLVLTVLLLIAAGAIWAIRGIGAFQPIIQEMSVKDLARLLFTGYLLPFEAITILIISSVIGALYIARREET